MLRGFATVSFFAEDMAAAKAWYTELLELEPYFAVPNAETPVIWSGGSATSSASSASSTPSSPRTTVSTKPAGAVIFWHVDDLEGSVERLLSLGATLNDPITERGDTGFRTASVVDPFGNILGMMNNPHYLEILAKLNA